MSGTPPLWKRPSDVMKIHRKKRPSGPRVGYIASPGEQSPVSAESRARNKRKNPFGCSPRKRVNKMTEPEDQTAQSLSAQDGDLFDVLNKKDRDLCGSPAPLCADTEAYNLTDSVPTQHQTANKNNISIHVEPTEARPPEPHPCFPQDWSLRLKARYVSSQSFSWCCPLKAAEEAKGMERLLQNSPPLTEPNPQSCLAKTELHRCCLYWVHPNIPWLKLFPRMIADNKIGKMSAVLQDKDVLDSLMADWTESFTSAFHLLRSGACPDFYLSCHQFTVAFFAANTRQSCPLEAIITPTSRGLRESLKKEGIEFSLPLQPKQESEGTTNDKPSARSQSQSQSHTNGDVRTKSVDEGRENEAPEKEEGQEEAVDDDEDIEATDEAAASWLETLGLDKRHYRSLDPSKVKLQRDSYRVIDNRPESTVVVTGHQTQALFNFLLNCRSCVANTGVQGGIPPTILSTSTFKGATLKTLKVKQGSIRQQASTQASYSLEVTGPLLPSTYRKLNHLLSLTQPDYSAAYSVHEVTAPFNLLPEGDEDSETTETLDRSASVNLGKQVIHELNFSEDGFTWTKY